MNLKYINLRKPALLMMCVCALIGFTNCEQDETQQVAELNNLVWSDEFNQDGAPNPENWTYDIGDGTNRGIPAGWGNGELQFYREENAHVENGVLVITAKEESFGGYNYTSARLITEGLREQEYGRFEARMKLPHGTGLWPAFWLLGNDCDVEGNEWPQCGEIDIMENVGDQPTLVFGSVHGPGYNAGDSVGKDYELDNGRFDESFHIFGIEWGPDYINYYVDGDLYQQITPELVDEEAIKDGDPSNAGEWVFNGNPFYIIINVAVGGNLPGEPNAETEFPQRLIVDYVRVYN